MKTSITLALTSGMKKQRSGANMLKHLFIIGCAAAFVGGFVTGKSAFAYSQQDEVTCLADNMYWEARNQPIKGMIAVALVTMNRVADDRYPDTVCQVVEQGPTRPSWKDPSVYYPVRHRCQFSWYCDGKGDTIPTQDLDIYDVILAYAYKIYQFHGSQGLADFTDGATHYHADYVRPAWAETKTPTTKIGAHIFYRWEK